jgi:hypothetical protein
MSGKAVMIESVCSGSRPGGITSTAQQRTPDNNEQHGNPEVLPSAPGGRMS